MWTIFIESIFGKYATEAFSKKSDEQKAKTSPYLGESGVGLSLKE
ncbi:MAG: hypothetical protein AAGA75_03655 [Cyanobacteria bacterium P01_E01_bin.6]